MQTDSHFMIGSTHDGDSMPCQDYARSLVLDGAAFAIISDGCSTGGETDNGSRIVAHATAQALRKHWLTCGSPFADGTVQQIALEQRIVMGASRDMLGLANEDLYATSLYAYYTKKGGIAHMLGDGVVAWQKADGTLTAVRFEWLRPNPVRPPAPLYPAYYVDDYKEFIRYYGAIPVMSCLRSETWELAPGTMDFVPVQTKEYTLSEGIRGPVIQLEPGLRYIAVFSDGVTQVEGVDWKEAVRRLMAFKTTAGSFVKRRMGRFYKEVKKTGCGATDDLSCAVIFCDDQEEVEGA